MADEESIDYILHWDCYPEPHPWWISAYIVCIFCIICNVTLVILNIRYLFIENDVELDSFIKKRANKLFYMFIIILYTVGPLVFFIVDSLQIGCALTVYLFMFGKGTGLNIMTFASEMLYLFYVLRVKRVFEHIPGLKMSKPLEYFLYFGVVAMIVSQSVSYWWYLQAWKDITIEKNRALALQFSFVALAFYVIFAIVVLATFHHKVKQLLRQTKDEQSKKGKKASRNAATFATRYLWLATIALLTTMVLAVVSVFRLKSGLKLSMLMIKNICLTIDTVVNVLCLYLQFPFADSWYSKMCICNCTFFLPNINQHKRKKAKKKKDNSETGFTVESATTISADEGRPLSAKQNNPDNPDHDHGRTDDVTQSTLFTELAQEHTSFTRSYT